MRAIVSLGRTRDDQARLVGDDDGLASIAQAELAEHATDVSLDGLLADDESRGDLVVREPPRSG
jgi:hypothetical protein